MLNPNVVGGIWKEKIEDAVKVQKSRKKEEFMLKETIQAASEAERKLIAEGGGAKQRI